MYKLESGNSWTQELKNAFKTGTTYSSIIYKNTDYNESNFLKEAELQDIRYAPNVGIFGQAISRMLTIKMVNDDTSKLNFENADIQFKIGAKYNNVIYYINYGNFIVNEPPENDDTNGTVKFVAYDYMIKFNKPYVNQVTYPCTLKNLLLNICQQAGVTLGTTSFANENFEVEDNQFEGKQLRDVLQHIAKCAFSWARIGQDNKLYLDFAVKNTIDETITVDDYKMDAFKKANEYYGPVNKVTFADSDIQGQEESVQDDSSIEENGLKEVIIYNNYFAYTTEKRHELIQEGTRLFGLRYMPIQKLELNGLVYLDCTDILGVKDGDNNTFLTRNFSHIIKYNGVVSDTIETGGESDNEQEYANLNNPVAQNSRTEIIVDRAKKQIESVVEEQTAQNQKIARVTQTVDELNSKISDIADVTASLESNNAKLNFEDINQSEPVRIVVHPVGTNIAKLHPHIGLKPRTGLKLTTRIIRFINTSTNETWDYEIPRDLLYYDNENYDEFILDYDSQTCTINKKCKWNSDGTVGLLSKETSYEHTYPQIELTDGDYEIKLIQYNSAYLFARLMVQNIYTTQFATKAEVNSEISQTVDDINLSVNQKFANYSTKTEVSAAIDIKADEITNKVSETYSTKTETEIAKDEAVSRANSNTDTKLQSYSTTTQMNSAIDQKANQITSTVSETYSTKTETTKAKNDAINSANASTDNKLKSYSTTTQMNSAIDQKANQITSTVSETYSTKTEINDAINNIEIGGRNLLLRSSVYQVNTPYSLKPTSDDTYVRLSTIQASVTKGKTYCLQCNTDGLWSKHKDIGNRYCTIWIVSTSSENKERITVNQVFEGNKQETGRKTWKWVSNITGTVGIRLNVYGEGNATVKFWNLKLEEGNKPTDWTAPDEDYSTTTQMNSAIDQKANQITSTVSETYSTKTETTKAKNDAISSANTSTDNKLKSYSTTTQMNSAITQKADTIMTSVNKKVDQTEVGTYITQNTDSVKLAWNQISEYIQMMIINNNASFAILDSTKKPIAYFDKTGIHFSSNDTAFGEMGVQTVDNNKFISFSVDGKYGQEISNGMAWGIKTTSDNKFHPIFYIKNFKVGNKSSDASFGELVLSASNLVLDGIGTGLVTGGIKIFGDPTAGGMYFYDENKEKYLMRIYPEDNTGYSEIHILDKIYFYKNQQGSNSLRVGSGDNYCLLTDDGYISGNTLYIRESATFVGECSTQSSFWADGDIHSSGNISANGNMYASNFISDKRLKYNIKESDKKALDIINKIKIYSYNMKTTKKHFDYGFIAQELEKIDKSYILKEEIKGKEDKITDYKYYVNVLPIIATLTKAIKEQEEQRQEDNKKRDEMLLLMQEQQKQIEELQKEIKELKGGK